MAAKRVFPFNTYKSTDANINQYSVNILKIVERLSAKQIN